MFQAFLTWPRHASKHTLPRLARSTINELQQNQHEKASLVCVRVQSPSGLALVPCVEYGPPKWPITMLNHTNIPGTEKCFVFYFWHPMLVRPVMKRLFFFLENQGKKGSLRSRASLLFFTMVYWKSQNIILLANKRGVHRQPAHSSKGKY